MSPAQVVAFEIARQLRFVITEAAEEVVELANEHGVSAIDVLNEQRKVMGNMYRAAGVRACRECGCTDDEGCSEGCFWSLTGEDLCSRCERGEVVLTDG